MSDVSESASLILSGKELPWVASATHLGHELHESGTMDYDIRVKRGEFISKSTDIRETFFFASPVEVLRAVKVFAGDMYGASEATWLIRCTMLGTPASSWPGRSPEVPTHTL